MIARVACALFSVGAFAASAALTGRLNRTFAAMVFACGLVVHILAAFALVGMHRADRRPAWEPVLLVLVPAAAWWALGGPGGRDPRVFWTFVGAFQFVAVTGGFLLGVFLSPLVAVGRGLDGAAAAAGVRFGLAWLRRFKGPEISAAVLFGGATAGWIALSVHASRACGFGRLPVASRAAVALLAAVATAAVAALAYRHTLFGMLERRRTADAQRPTSDAQHPTSKGSARP